MNHEFWHTSTKPVVYYVLIFFADKPDMKIQEKTVFVRVFDGIIRQKFSKIATIFNIVLICISGYFVIVDVYVFLPYKIIRENENH